MLWIYACCWTTSDERSSEQQQRRRLRQSRILLVRRQQARRKTCCATYFSFPARALTFIRAFQQVRSQCQITAKPQNHSSIKLSKFWKSDSKRTKSGLRADYDRTHSTKNGVIVVLSNDLDRYSNFSGGDVAQWASSRPTWRSRFDSGRRYSAYSTRRVPSSQVGQWGYEAIPCWQKYGSNPSLGHWWTEKRLSTEVW